MLASPLRFTFTRHIFLLLVPTLVLLLLPVQSSAATATVAVASNFHVTMISLAESFKKHSIHDLRIVGSSTGVLYNQIVHGAPFDLLLAADSLRPTELEQQDFGVKGSRFTYATGGLALVVAPRAQLLESKAIKLDQDFIDLLNNSSGKIAIANPKLAPYGMAAKQTLAHLDLWTTIKPRLVLGNNIAQSYQFVATGNVSVGFVALTQVFNTKNSLNYWPVPVEWHQPIHQQAVLLQAGSGNEAAIDFLNFIKSPIAKAIIRSDGYNTPTN